LSFARSSLAIHHVAILVHSGRQRAPERRPAFTLVELLVVIAIVGVLVALLLPAVQAAREAGRRSECQNHLRQLGLAVTNYSNSLRLYPASGIVNTALQPYDSKSGKMFSWAVLILPYIEQSALHEQFNFNVSVLAQASTDPQAAQPPVYLCASDGAKGRIYQDATHTSNKRLGKGNYAAFASPYHLEYSSRYRAALTSHLPHTSGIFSDDGTSTTLMLTEVRTRIHAQDQRGAWAIGWSGASLLAYDMHDTASVNYSASGFKANLTSVGHAQPPNNQGPNLDMIYNCIAPAEAQLDKIPCSTWVSSGSFNYFSAAPRSQHPRGVNTVYVDGHVSFLTDTVDQLTMAYLISLDDGQTVQAQ
jgi:prepilin-type N-terminal cleavage/methylation domain-containing protein/prepilin-type processing-associated H-X9-DG protein